MHHCRFLWRAIWVKNKDLLTTLQHMLRQHALRQHTLRRRAQATHAQATRAQETRSGNTRSGNTRSGDALRQHTLRRHAQATRAQATHAQETRSGNTRSGDALRQHTLRQHAQSTLTLVLCTVMISIWSKPSKIIMAVSHATTKPSRYKADLLVVETAAKRPAVLYRDLCDCSGKLP